MLQSGLLYCPRKTFIPIFMKCVSLSPQTCVNIYLAEFGWTHNYRWIPTVTQTHHTITASLVLIHLQANYAIAPKVPILFTGDRLKVCLQRHIAMKLKWIDMANLKRANTGGQCHSSPDVKRTTHEHSITS